MCSSYVFKINEWIIVRENLKNIKGEYNRNIFTLLKNSRNNIQKSMEITPTTNTEKYIEHVTQYYKDDDKVIDQINNLAAKHNNTKNTMVKIQNDLHQMSQPWFMKKIQ